MVTPNNVSSNSVFSGLLRDVKNCIANVALPTIVDDLNPFSTEGLSGALGMGATGSSSLSQSMLDQTALYIAAKGLTVPLRSSTVQGGLSLATKFGKLSGILSMVGIDYALADAVYAEYKGCL